MARHSPATPSAVADRDRLPDDELALLRAAVWRQRQLVFFRLLPLLAVVIFVSARLVDHGFFWLAALLPTVTLGFTLVHAHRARAAASEISDDHVFDARALIEIDARSWGARLVPAVVVGLIAGVVLAREGAASGAPRPARASSLRPSQWQGEMEFLQVKYPFVLTFKDVTARSVAGTIAWQGFPAGTFAGQMRTDDAGDHLTLIDNDGDRKDVVVNGSSLTGTDKNGRATFNAHLLPPAPFGALHAGEVPVGLVLSAVDLHVPTCEGFSVRFDTAVVELDPPRLWVPFDIVGSGRACSATFTVDLADEGGARSSVGPTSWRVDSRIETLSGNNAGATVALTERSSSVTIAVHVEQSTYTRRIDLNSLRVQP